MKSVDSTRLVNSSRKSVFLNENVDTGACGLRTKNSRLFSRRVAPFAKKNKKFGICKFGGFVVVEKNFFLNLPKSLESALSSFKGLRERSSRAFSVEFFSRNIPRDRHIFLPSSRAYRISGTRRGNFRKQGETAIDYPMF